MKLNQSIINEYNEFGVVVIRNVLSSYWLEQLSVGIDKNFKNPSKYNAFMKKKIIKKFSLMIIAIGNE